MEPAGTLTSGLLGFWALSTVSYSKKHKEHNVSETDPFSKTCSFLFFRIRDDGLKPKTQQSWVLYTIVRTLETTCSLPFSQKSSTVPYPKPDVSSP
jgi:hypothetical protein